MDFFTSLYNQKLAENDKNIRFWADYIAKLKALDFTVFENKLKVPALVPIGSRVLFRGELKHTNEVTVALGADYFVKCSVHQAEVLRQHRIRGAQSKLETFHKEKEFLESQLSLGNDIIHERGGQDIVEFHTEEEDRQWREQHRENVRKNKQNEIKIETEKSIKDEELWERLEELELQEELENEFLSMKEDQLERNKPSLNIFSETLMEMFSEGINTEKTNTRRDYIPKNNYNINTGTFDANTVENQTENRSTNSENLVTFSENKVTNSANQKVTHSTKAADEATKLDLLQKVLDKQNELGDQMQELRCKDWGHSTTEVDLIRKLDQMEQLDELEDEMERLEDLIGEENYETDESPTVPLTPPKTNLDRRVSFADEQDNDTIEITFQHSNIQPNIDHYDTEKGIQKPSDIYEAYSFCHNSETTSILKKKHYESAKVVPNSESISILKKKDYDSVQKTVTNKVKFEMNSSEGGGDGNHEKSKVNETIVVRDVVEKSTVTGNLLETKARPTSLFKMRRQQSK